MYLLYYLLGIYLLWNYMCYGVYVDIKRQLVGVSCLLPTCGSWGPNSVAGLAANTLTCWAISLVHSVYKQKQKAPDSLTPKSVSNLQL